MRKKQVDQLPLIGVVVNHEHAREIQAMGTILDSMPELVDLVHGDLIRGLKSPDVGREGLTAEQTLRALLLKQMRSWSYDELTFHLADSATYREFCRFGYHDPIPAKSTIQCAIKRLRPETLEAINKQVLMYAKEEGIETGRKVRVDATGVETNIHKPSDSDQLFDVVRVLTRIMKKHGERFGLNFKNQERRAKRRQVGLLNEKKKEAKKKLYRDLLKVTRRTISEALRLAPEIEAKDPAALRAAQLLRHFSGLGNKVISQTERRVLKEEDVPAQEKILSIFEPHTDIIIKDNREITYGHKITLATGASKLILDCVIEKGNPNDSTRAVPMIERQTKLYGRAPRQASFDGGYASKENLAKLKEAGVKDVAFSKRRGMRIEDMAKSPWVYRMLTRFRAGIESGISYLKRCLGLTRVTWRGEQSFKSYVWSSVITANLLMLARQSLNG